MKRTLLLFSILLFWSCSNFQDNYDYASAVDIDRPLDEIVTDLPIINIVVDAEAFANMYEMFTEDIELETASFNLYRHGELVIENEAIELQLKGNFSKKFPLKSLGVKFDDRYDNSSRALINPSKVLPFHSIEEIKSIRLRNSGNDFVHTMLKDLSYTQLAIAADLDLDLGYGEPSVVFINNEFYGLLNIRTEVNTNGMAALYDVKKSAITLGKIDASNLNKKDGDFEKIDLLVQAINDKDISAIKAQIDLSNFIDYMVFETYIANEDWPHTNVRFFAVGDGKFRCILHDLDKANDRMLRESPVDFIDKRSKSIISELFLVLYKDEVFYTQFWKRYRELLNSGLLSHDKFKAIVEHNMSVIEEVMPLQIKKYESPSTMIEWLIEVDKLHGTFERRERIVKNIVSEDF
ncbi:MAG: CotH kinase family protein [Bacteroidota bacterium]